MPFIDRADAGRRLAERLERFRGEDIVVLGLPRGGVPVAFEVARALDAPLDVIVVRKLGVPFQPELAMGAIGEDGARVLNTEIIQACQIASGELDGIEVAERAELDRRAGRFRHGRTRIPLRGRTALIVDDGVATGSTARAACQVARAQGAERVVLAVPVGAYSALATLREEADAVVCLETPSWFRAVGEWYDDFRQTSDQQVVDLLERAAARTDLAGPATTGADPRARDEEVEVFAGMIPLVGQLSVPADAVGMVVFAHGSGSSRHSPRNRHVARILNEAGIGTLLFDLLTRGEETDRRLVFDIELLARRLIEATRWLRTQPGCADTPIGYFGASTGAAAALWAAAASDIEVAAVVSRGGRPDLAAAQLPWVRSPTLLIVGSHDPTVLELNRQAQRRLHCETRLAVVPGATHLFEEPGTLDQAAQLARDWFLTHLRRGEKPLRPSAGARP